MTGLLDFRSDLLALGIQGFQWLGGSFVEDIESHEGRDPGDLDMVTFTGQPADAVSLGTKLAGKPELLSKDWVREAYRLDHLLVPLATPADKLVELSSFWYGLYSHRKDRVWKGMLKIKLTDRIDDYAARVLVEGQL